MKLENSGKASESGIQAKSYLHLKGQMRREDKIQICGPSAFQNRPEKPRQEVEMLIFPQQPKAGSLSAQRWGDFNMVPL